MSRTPPMGEQAERELRAEMAAWDKDRLIAKIAKEPGFAAGIAAQQVLDERLARETEARHKDLLSEISKPQWKTPNFWLAAVAAVTGCISVYPVLWPKKDIQPSGANIQPTPPHAAPVSRPPQPVASTPPANTQPASSPPPKLHPLSPPQSKTRS